MIPSLRQDGKIIADLHFDFAKMIFCFFSVRKDLRKIVKDNLEINIGCFFRKNSNACRNANILHGGQCFSTRNTKTAHALENVRKPLLKIVEHV